MHEKCTLRTKGKKEHVHCKMSGGQYGWNINSKDHMARISWDLVRQEKSDGIKVLW